MDRFDLTGKVAVVTGGNNGSMMSIFGAPWAPAYAASKGGMVQLTKALASRASDFVTGAAIPVDGGYSVMV